MAKTECPFCRWGNGNHAPDCPQGNPDQEKRWHQGWADGRNDRMRTADDPPYAMGYLRGECALEEAQNGHDPRFHL